MKKFFSDCIFTESDDLFASLISLIDSKIVLNKAQILSDIHLHESQKDECASYKNIFVHTARTRGIGEFCLSCAVTSDERIEILILWNEISEHILDKLAEISGFLQKSAENNFSFEHIIYELKKI